MKDCCGNLGLMCRATAILLFGLGQANGGVLLSEGWENPSLNPGATTTSLPSGWNLQWMNNGNYGIWNPDNTQNFNQYAPLASPAGGSQLLFLGGTNTGVNLTTNFSIEANTIYTLSAAIGNGNTTLNDGWSLQLWATTNVPGQDTFIGQQFGTSATAINATPGNWVTNSFTFDSSTTPSLVGSNLVILMNNYLGGTTYYDNVVLESQTASVPEPSSLVLWSLGGLSVILGGLYRRQQSAVTAA